jgi:hypothetical protein
MPNRCSCTEPCPKFSNEPQTHGGGPRSVENESPSFAWGVRKEASRSAKAEPLWVSVSLW